MRNVRLINRVRRVLSAVVVVGLFGATNGFAGETHSTTKFEGIKADTGSAIHSRQGNSDVLAVSDDFKIPNTPAPHWQVVDSKGNVYLLQQFRINDGKVNRKIVVPSYIQDVAKVQVWCSFAEALLGETSFPTPIKTVAASEGAGMTRMSSAMGR